jgi:hypothetical protein
VWEGPLGLGRSAKVNLFILWPGVWIIKGLDKRINLETIVELVPHITKRCLMSSAETMRRWIKKFAETSCGRLPLDDTNAGVLFVVPFLNAAEFSLEYFIALFIIRILIIKYVNKSIYYIIHNRQLHNLPDLWRAACWGLIDSSCQLLLSFIRAIVFGHCQTRSL